jgi:hypothetical protein
MVAGLCPVTGLGVITVETTMSMTTETTMSMTITISTPLGLLVAWVDRLFSSQLPSMRGWLPVLLIPLGVPRQQLVGP